MASDSRIQVVRCEDTFQKGATGVEFSLKLVNRKGKLNLDTATTKKMVFRKSNLERIERTAVFKTDGRDGIIQYFSVDGDLDVAGVWQVQGVVTSVSPAWHWPTCILEFEILENL